MNEAISLPARAGFSVSFLVAQSALEAFNAINNVQGWWTEVLEGETFHLGDEFSVRFGDVHYSRQKLVESVPGRRVAWLVTESQLNFLENKNEWTGTRIVFDINPVADHTEVRFTHEGLLPEIECCGACSNAWTGYISNSLQQLIATGKGQPARRALAQ
jgi:hypothetical protein